MDQVLVTGGAGFIGSHLVERLLENGREVVCLDNFDDFYCPEEKRRNLERAGTSPDFTLVEGDVRDADLLERLFRTHAVGLVVHLAARAGVRPSLRDPMTYAEMNIRGTLTLLEAMRKAGLGKLVFGSSSSVYGGNRRVPFRETDPVDRPISPYAATKKAAEVLCYTYHHLFGMDMTVLRFFTVYGPRQRPDMAIRKFTEKIVRGDAIPFYGDGSTKRDYTFVDDIIQGVWKALDGIEGYEIYNLGESETTSLRDLVGLIEAAVGRKAILEKLPPQPGDPPVTFADISKAREKLGYAPATPIADGIERFVDWYLSAYSPGRDTHPG
jgi:UDP-glucuronate 4-epimerase